MVFKPNTNTGLFIPQDRPFISEQQRLNTIAAATIASAASKSGSHSTRVYQNVKQNADIMIPLQRPNTTTGLHGHKQFGMRALFM